MNLNHQIPLFVYLLMEKDYRRNYMRIKRRMLRDTQNPFTVPDNTFISYYRLNKDLVRNLINILENHARLPVKPGAIPFHLKVFVTLYFLANGSYQTPVGNSSLNSVSQSTVSRAITEVCRLITVYLMPEFIKFPTTLEAKINVKSGFYKKWMMPGIIGAIDGTHVEIVAPSITDLEHPPFVYLNRKGKYSINVMLISDSDCRILAVNARYPGSVHDSAIWQMSNIKQYLRRVYENGDINSVLIGDSGYGLEPWLLTPFGNYNEGTPEALYNSMQKSARNVIERTNGILKGRFRCLSQHRVLHYNPAKAADIIYSCTVLHNLDINARLEMNEIDIEFNVDDYNQVNVDPHDYDVLVLGRETRNNYIALNINI